jgi:hypothetical protein
MKDPTDNKEQDAEGELDSDEELLWWSFLYIV